MSRTQKTFNKQQSKGKIRSLQSYTEVLTAKEIIEEAGFDVPNRLINKLSR